MQLVWGILVSVTFLCLRFEAQPYRSSAADHVAFSVDVLLVMVLPISPYISLYLPISPYITLGARASTWSWAAYISLYLPISPYISLYLPISP